MRDLGSLADELAVARHINRLAHAIDGLDWPAVRAAFADDAAFDFTGHRVVTDIATIVGEPFRGADAFVQAVRSIQTGWDAAQHYLTGMVHDVAGDHAHVRCNVLAEHFLNNDQGDRSISVGGRYEFELRRVGEGWLITRWCLRTSWYRGNAMLYSLAAAAASRKLGQGGIDRPGASIPDAISRATAPDRDGGALDPRTMT